ncbi:MAG: PAS domain S-box protein [Bacteroidetes bacterium]|nr:PAS domain S-box protein [Bacteroidota bacterium]HET6243575.1 ATP-binding protein [Bacteroidia bacterium]
MEENIFDTLFRTIPLAVIIIEKENMNFLKVNPAATSTLGYSENELLTMSMKDIVSGADINEILNNLNGIPEKETVTFFIQNIKKKSDKIDFQVTACNIIYKNKDCILKFAKETTALFFEELFNSSPFAIAFLNGNEQINAVNKTFEKNFNFSTDELKNRTLPQTFIPEEYFAEHQEMTEKVNDGQYVQLQTKIKTKENELMDVLAVKFPVMIDKKIKGSYAIYLDISEEKKAQKELKELYSELERRVSERTKVLESAYSRLEEINVELEEVAKSKDKFISIISHDLRNPVSAIISTSEIMIKNAKTLEQEMISDFTKIINRASVKIIDQLNELVALSKQKTKKINFDPQNRNLYELVSLSTELIIENAKQKEIQIINEVDKSFQVWVDPFLIRSVFQNLVTNSVKFTPKGGRIIVSALKKGNSFIQVSIKDTGIGMSDEDSKKLFSDEAVISNSEPEKGKSTGLGLILVKDFIKKHKGKVWVESELGKGTTFHFTLPIGKADHQPNS